MDFLNMKSLFIDGQEVKTLSINNKIVWNKKSSRWNGLKFTSEEDGSNVYMYKSGYDTPKVSLMYSLDEGQTWNDFTVCSSSSSLDGTIINLDKVGDSVCFKAGEDGNISMANPAYGDSNRFNCIGKIIIKSNINSVLDGDNFEGIVEYGDRGGFIFNNLFVNGSCFVDASELELPATTLTGSCYQLMFSGCTSLTTAPELPATTLAGDCYFKMFYNCTSLVKAPSVLPSTTLANYCYQRMFSGCTSLTTAPELSSTKMAYQCYSNMFYGCTSLKRIKMNASSGNWGTYMFYGCTSLELVDMTGSTGVPTLSNVDNFNNTNDTYKIVVPDSLYNTWIEKTNWAAISSHIMKQSDWNASHPDDILG